MWAEAPVNEEAAEPFLLLSNCMLVRLLQREVELQGIKCSDRSPLPSFAFSFPLFNSFCAAVHLSLGGPEEDIQWSEEPVATGPLYC